MKKLMLLLVSLLVLGTVTACGDKGPGGELVIGTPPLTGDFVNGFSNSAYDRMITDMIWGYGTYETSPEGEFVLNKTVVKSVDTALDDAGNKSYTFVLNKGLKFSDGVEVTAADFVFSVLLNSSPEWKAVDGNSFAGEDLLGWEAYETGAAKSFPGVKWLADDSFSVTINAESIPYFYEVAIASVGPQPMHAWANGAKIGADGSSLEFGAEPFVAKDGSEEVAGPVVASLADVANHVNTKERYAPTVSAGPFRFVSYAQETATVENNPNFAGDYRGNKAKLEKVIVKRINEELDVDYVINGDIDITTGVVEGAKIKKAKDNEDKVSMVNYPRSGYGYLAFHTDFGPTAEAEVRQAVAYSIDRQVFVEQILEGYGVLVNGEYGLSQWMYQEKKADLDANLINYVNNSEKANEALDKSTYVFEKDGTTKFDVAKASGAYLRHNAKGEELVIRHAGSTGNPITDLIGTMLPENLAKAGVKFELEQLDFNSMLAFYQKPDTQAAAYGARRFHTFNLATSFTAVYDPYSSFHSDYLGTPYNSTQTNHPAFDELTVKLRKIDSEDKQQYADVWYDYQVEWNKYLPMVPLYSNQYHDIFANRVKDVKTTPIYMIGRAAIDITVE